MRKRGTRCVCVHSSDSPYSFSLRPYINLACTWLRFWFVFVLQVYRELFHFHKARVVLIGVVGAETNRVVSVDESGTKRRRRHSSITFSFPHLLPFFSSFALSSLSPFLPFSLSTFLPFSFYPFSPFILSFFLFFFPPFPPFLPFFLSFLLSPLSTFDLFRFAFFFSFVRVRGVVDLHARALYRQVLVQALQLAGAGPGRAHVSPRACW